MVSVSVSVSLILLQPFNFNALVDFIWARTAVMLAFDAIFQTQSSQSSTRDYHPSPQVSSSSADFGFRSIFFATIGLEGTVFFGAAFCPAALPVLPNPLGSGLPLVAPLFFASQAAKSGSASSKGVAVLLTVLCGRAEGFDGGLVCVESSFSSPSSMSPQASKSSTAVGSGSVKNESPPKLAPAEDDRDSGAEAGGDLSACRCSAEADDVAAGRAAGRLVSCRDCVGVAVPFASISPAAADNLFVKEEIAQPAQLPGMDDESG